MKSSVKPGLFDKSYFNRVMGCHPIAYWPLWEASGVVANCLSNALQNAAYNSDVSTWPAAPGIGDGLTAPTYDGTNDTVNALTATLAAAFNGVEGGFTIWFKHAALSHGDATLRRMLFTQVDANNYIIIAKTGAASNIQFDFNAGGVVEQGFLPLAALPADYNFLAITWSKANDRVRYYYNQTLIQTDINLGVWAGVPASFFIGSSTAGPVHPYYGNLAHAALFDYEPSTEAINRLALL